MQYISGEEFGPAVGAAMWYLGRGFSQNRTVAELLGNESTSWLTRTQARNVARQAAYNRAATEAARQSGGAAELGSLFAPITASADRIGIRIVWDLDLATGRETGGRVFNFPAGTSLSDAIARATAWRAAMGNDTPGLTPAEPDGLPGQPRIVAIYEGGIPGGIDL